MNDFSMQESEWYYAQELQYATAAAITDESSTEPVRPGGWHERRCDASSQLRSTASIPCRCLKDDDSVAMQRMC